MGANKRPGLTATGRERLAAMNTLVKQGWGADNPAFRQIFTSLLMPTANKNQADAFNELQRLSASPECAARYLETVGDLTVVELLSQVKAPTLVMHVRDDFPFRSNSAANWQQEYRAPGSSRSPARTMFRSSRTRACPGCSRN